MKKIVAVISLLLVLVGAWWFASPWWSLKGMKEAGDARDAAAFSEHIDFPALRADVKAETLAELKRQYGGDGQIEMAAAEAMIGPAIDAALSEDGVKRMFDMAATADNMPFPTFQGDELPEIERRGFGEFVVNQENGEPGLVFHRVGLGWKLAGIEVPEAPAPTQ
ncbi:DUF2939 domain-containing protein [Sphingomicrobium flavum]|uniref:DUF2939 domain-containing protein n=1 Tax=Sphingomicrobium flavum TaxID=1229164 RepID=UPI0021AE0467|nr:DUF2939 domain-containing protein [Sphingomicrobium flavum]